jgi:hypothetical protein
MTNVGGTTDKVLRIYTPITTTVIPVQFLGSDGSYQSFFSNGGVSFLKANDAGVSKFTSINNADSSGWMLNLVQSSGPQFSAVGISDGFYSGYSSYEVYGPNSGYALYTTDGSHNASFGNGYSAYFDDGINTLGFCDGSNMTVVNGSPAYTGPLNDSSNNPIADVVGGIITAVYY